MQTTRDFATATRAEMLARLIQGLTADVEAGRVIERVQRVAQAVETDRQRAIVWLHQTLSYELVMGTMLIALGFDRWVVDAAGTLGMRHREGVREYAKRVAACSDIDVLAVALAAIDEDIGEGSAVQHDTLAAYKKARRVLKRAADALANQQPGDPPAAGGVADNRPTAPALRNALMALVDHTNGARDALMQMMRGPGNVPWGVTERLSLEDLELLVVNLHDLMQVVALLVIDVTARNHENTYEDRLTLAESRTKGVNPMQGMERIAQTTARRLRDFNEVHGGEQLENGKVH